MVNIKVVDSNPQIGFFKSGDSSNAMVKMVNQTNEFKIQKYTGSGLEDVMKINEDGVITFPKNVQFLGEQTTINTQTLTVQDQQVDIGLSNTIYLDTNPANIAKTSLPGSTTMTISDKTNVTLGSTYVIAKTNNSLSPGYLTGSNPAPIIVIDNSNLSGNTLTLSGNYAGLSTDNLGLYKLNSSNPNPSLNSEAKIYNVTTLSGGLTTISFDTNANMSFYSVNNLFNISAAEVPNSMTFGLIGKIGRITAVNISSKTITVRYDSTVSNDGAADGSGSRHTMLNYSLVSGASISASNFLSGGYNYTFRLQDSNAAVPFVKDDYVLIQNMVKSDGSTVFLNTALLIDSVNNLTTPYTFSIKSSTLNITTSDIVNAANVTVSKLLTVGSSAGLRLLGVNSGTFVNAGLNFDSSRNIKVENNSGKVIIGGDTNTYGVDIGSSGSRAIALGSSSAASVSATASTVSLSGSGNSSFNTTTGSLNLSGAGGVNINSTTADIVIGNEDVTSNTNKITLGAGGRPIELGNTGSSITIKGAITLQGTLSSDTISGSTVSISSTTSTSINSSGNTDLKIAANSGSTKNLSISADNAGAGSAFVNIDSKSGIMVGNNTQSQINVQGTTIDISSKDSSNLTVLSDADSTKTLRLYARNINTGSNAKANLDLDATSRIKLGANSATQVDVNATAFNLTASNALKIDSSNSIQVGTAQDVPVTVKADTLSMTASGDSSLKLVSNATANKTLEVSAVNTGTGVANLNVSADGAVSINGTNALNIGNTTATATTVNATTFGLSTSGNLNIDSASAINIGTTQSKPLTINSSTLGVTSNDNTDLILSANSSTNKVLTIEAKNIHATGTSSMVVKADGNMAIDGATGVYIGTSTPSAFQTNSTTFDINATGLLTLDSTNSIAIGATNATPFSINASTYSASASSTYQVNASSTLSLNSSGGVINIGNNNVNQNINIGTDGVRTITLGKEGSSVNAYNFTAMSDVILKTNIQALNSTLDKVVQLNGFSYNWKEATNKGTQIGFIAQDIEQQFPELVTTLDNGYKSVNYLGMTAVLLQAIKEQQAEIDALKRQ